MRKYDGYWEGLRAELLQMIDDAAAGKTPTRQCTDITSYGERQSWYGVAVIGDGQLTERTPNAAHLLPLRTLAPALTRKHPGRRFRFEMSRNAQLRVTLIPSVGAPLVTQLSNVRQATPAERESVPDTSGPPKQKGEVPRGTGLGRLGNRSEDEFADRLVAQLLPRLDGYRIETRASLFYSLSVEPNGEVLAPVTPDGKPVRGGGVSYQQDILVYEQVSGNRTSVIPYVAAEVKYLPPTKRGPGATTHDALTYGEKARRIKEIYPYARYGFILGGLVKIPTRILRLGAYFDFIVAVPDPVSDPTLDQLTRIFWAEIDASQQLRKVLSGHKVTLLHRQLSTED